MFFGANDRKTNQNSFSKEIFAYVTEPQGIQVQFAARWSHLQLFPWLLLASALLYIDIYHMLAVHVVTTPHTPAPAGDLPPDSSTLNGAEKELPLPKCCSQISRCVSCCLGLGHMPIPVPGNELESREPRAECELRDEQRRTKQEGTFYWRKSKPKWEPSPGIPQLCEQDVILWCDLKVRMIKYIDFKLRVKREQDRDLSSGTWVQDLSSGLLVGALHSLLYLLTGWPSPFSWSGL